MSKVSTSSIKVGERLREDLGDIQEMMVSIQENGLLHPIVIDDERNLIAGARRLEAYRLLGKKQIPVTYFGTLSEDERVALELEENVRRKDLTAYERSKATKELVETAKEVISSESEEKEETKRGRPSKGKASSAEAAKRIGKSEGSVIEAEQHVAAGEKYPFLQGKLWKQKPAMEMAKILDEIGQKDVDYLYTFCRNGTGARPPQMRAFFETWNSASAATRRKLRLRLDGDNHRSSRTLSLMGKCSPRPDPALLWVDEALRNLKSLLKKRPGDDAFLPTMRSMQTNLERFQSKALKHNETSIEELRKELLS